MAPAKQRPKQPTKKDKSEWISPLKEYPATPNHIQYVFFIEACRADWERAGDPQPIGLALKTAQLHGQRPPDWAVDAAYNHLIRHRSDKQIQQYEADLRHRVRWWAVRDMRANDAKGDEAYELAAQKLKGTRASGSAETMKASYYMVQRELKNYPEIITFLDEK